MGPLPALSLMDQTMEFSWVPLGMKAKLKEDGTVSLIELTKIQVKKIFIFKYT